MCRLIVAHGRFSSAQVFDAALGMSCGRTADHDGPIQRHPNGWGAVWRDGGRTLCHRDPRAIEAAAAEPTPIRELTTQFLAIHVRHATLARNQGLACTHPLHYAAAGAPWYVLHNGFLPTVHQRLGRSSSEFDSAEYLEYLVHDAGPRLDLDATRDKLRAIPPGGSSANAILVGPECAYLIHWTPEDTPYPRYFTMHRLDAGDCTIIASEVLPAFAPRERWQAMPPRTIHPLGFPAELGLPTT